jgi:hypothetical protein
MVPPEFFPVSGSKGGMSESGSKLGSWEHETHRAWFVWPEVTAIGERWRSPDWILNFYLLKKLVNMVTLWPYVGQPHILKGAGTKHTQTIRGMTSSAFSRDAAWSLWRYIYIHTHKHTCARTQKKKPYHIWFVLRSGVHKLWRLLQEISGYPLLSNCCLATVCYKYITLQYTAILPNFIHDWSKFKFKFWSSKYINK